MQITLKKIKHNFDDEYHNWELVKYWIILIFYKEKHWLKWKILKQPDIYLP